MDNLILNIHMHIKILILILEFNNFTPTLLFEYE